MHKSTMRRAYLLTIPVLLLIIDCASDALASVDFWPMMKGKTAYADMTADDLLWPYVQVTRNNNPPIPE